MPEKETPLEKLEEWLKTVKLPESARTCIENFVYSCKEPEEKDLLNFVLIDIRDYSKSVQDKLIEGFCYAYSGKPMDFLMKEYRPYPISPN